MAITAYFRPACVVLGATFGAVLSFGITKDFLDRKFMRKSEPVEGLADDYDEFDDDFFSADDEDEEEEADEEDQPEDPKQEEEPAKNKGNKKK